MAAPGLVETLGKIAYAVCSSACGNLVHEEFKKRSSTLLSNLRGFRPGADDLLVRALAEASRKALIAVCEGFAFLRGFTLEAGEPRSLVPGDILDWLWPLYKDLCKRGGECDLSLSQLSPIGDDVLKHLESLLESPRVETRFEKLQESAATQAFQYLDSLGKTRTSDFNEYVKQNWFRLVCSEFQQILVCDQNLANAFHARLLAHVFTRLDEFQDALKLLLPRPPALPTRDDLVTYLRGIAQGATELPTYFPKRLRDAHEAAFDGIRRQARMVTEARAFEKWRAEHLERLRGAGLRVSEEACYEPLRSRPELKGLDQSLAREPVEHEILTWDDYAEHPRFRHVCVLGDPGFGKTWLLRHETRRLALRAIDALEKGQGPADLDVPLPLLLRLADLQRLEPTSDRLEGIIEHVLNVGRRPDTLRAYFQSMLRDGKVVLLLDAWDEALPADGRPLRIDPREPLRRKIENFAQGYSGRIVLTSRGALFDPHSPLPRAPIVELLAFDRGEIQAFAEVWFGQDADSFGSFLRQLYRHASVNGLARVPLLLSFLCKLFEPSGPGLPLRRCDLYQGCLVGLLRDWKIEDKPGSWVHDAIVKHNILELAQLAYQVFPSSGFETGQIARALNKPFDAAFEFCNRCLSDGVFVRSSAAQSGSVTFLHRTFHEYLAAQHLAAKANRKGWKVIAKEIDQESWDPAWREVIVLLAGLLDDPIPLLMSLSDEASDDLFRPRLALAGRCLPEILARPSGTPDRVRKLADQISSLLIDLSFEHRTNGTLHAIPSVVAALPALADVDVPYRGRPLREVVAERLETGQGVLFTDGIFLATVLGPSIADQKVRDILLQKLRDDRRQHPDIWEDRYALVQLFGELSLPLGSEDVASELLACLDDPEPYGLVCVAAAREVGRIGRGPAFDDALQILHRKLQSQNAEDKVDGAQMLKAIGPVAARDSILGALRICLLDENPDVKSSAAGALREMGPAAARGEIVAALLALLKDDSDEVKSGAIRALARVSSGGANPAVLAVLQNLMTDEETDLIDRQRAAWAFGLLAPQADVDKMVRGFCADLRDPDANVRYVAASWLEATGLRAPSNMVLHTLAERLNEDPDKDVRACVAQVFWRMWPMSDRESVIIALRDRLTDSNEDRDVRFFSIRVLGFIGPAVDREDVLAAILLQFKDPDHNVRVEAARAAGRIVRAQDKSSIVGGLLQLLNDRNYFVKSAASEALAEIGPSAATKSVVKALTERLRSQNGEERPLAARALGGIQQATPHIRLRDLLRSDTKAARHRSRSRTTKKPRRDES